MINPLLINALNLVADEVHENAIAKGFHNFTEDEGQFIARTTANIHGETSELWEAYRKHELRELCDKAPDMIAAGIEPLNCGEEELADIIIRAFDTAKRLNIDIGRAIALKHAYNKTRSFRHGGKLA